MIGRPDILKQKSGSRLVNCVLDNGLHKWLRNFVLLWSQHGIYAYAATHCTLCVLESNCCTQVVFGCIDCSEFNSVYCACRGHIGSLLGGVVAASLLGIEHSSDPVVSPAEVEDHKPLDMVDQGVLTLILRLTAHFKTESRQL